MTTVTTTLNYLAPMQERPRYYTFEPPAGTPWRNTKGDRRQVEVHDARGAAPPPGLETSGFEIRHLEVALADATDAEAVRSHYYPAVEQLVRDTTGAAQVLAFDHNIRHGDAERTGVEGLQGPVRFVHNDYTEASGPQRLRDLLGNAEALRVRGRRFAVINVWKPLHRPVEVAPLAVCDATTLAASDFIPTDLVYRDRTGEIYSLTFSPKHRWWYYTAMRPEEALLLKCYDSAEGRTRFTAHTAFDDPTSPPNAPPRQSIEVRTLSIF